MFNRGRSLPRSTRCDHLAMQLILSSLDVAGAWRARSAGEERGAHVVFVVSRAETPEREKVGMQIVAHVQGRIVSGRLSRLTQATFKAI